MAASSAPAAAHMDMYLNEDGSVNRDLATYGPLSAGIPGEIAAMAHIAEHYGKLPLAAACSRPFAWRVKAFPSTPSFT